MSEDQIGQEARTTSVPGLNDEPSKSEDPNAAAPGPNNEQGQVPEPIQYPDPLPAPPYPTPDEIVAPGSTAAAQPAPTPAQDEFAALAGEPVGGRQPDVYKFSIEGTVKYVDAPNPEAALAVCQRQFSHINIDACENPSVEMVPRASVQGEPIHS